MPPSASFPHLGIAPLSFQPTTASPGEPSLTPQAASGSSSSGLALNAGDSPSKHSSPCAEMGYLLLLPSCMGACAHTPHTRMTAIHRAGVTASPPLDPQLPACSPRQSWCSADERLLVTETTATISRALTGCQGSVYVRQVLEADPLERPPPAARVLPESGPASGGTAAVGEFTLRSLGHPAAAGPWLASALGTETQLPPCSA